MNKKQKKVFIRIIIAFALIIILKWIPVEGYVRFALVLPVDQINEAVSRIDESGTLK